MSTRRAGYNKLSAYLDNERTSSGNGSRHRSQDEEPGVVPGRDNEPDTLGLLLDPRIVQLEHEGSVPYSGLVLHPFGKTLDGQLDFTEGRPDLTGGL
jgi:hypothetical protein